MLILRCFRCRHYAADFFLFATFRRRRRRQLLSLIFHAICFCLCERVAARARDAYCLRCRHYFADDAITITLMLSPLRRYARAMRDLYVVQAPAPRVDVARLPLTRYVSYVTLTRIRHHRLPSRTRHVVTR